MADVPSELMRHWVHSHEEDHDGVRVYRPADYSFPPARGRRGFEPLPGGELRVFGPGADDRPEAASATWSASGSGGVRLGGEELEIVSVSPDRLELRPS